MDFTKRLTARVTGGWENQPTKRNQIPRLNQAQNAEPTSRPVHALLGSILLTIYTSCLFYLCRGSLTLYQMFIIVGIFWSNAGFLIVYQTAQTNNIDVYIIEIVCYSVSVTLSKVYS